MLIIFSNFIFPNNIFANGGAKTVFRSDEPINIYTKIGRQTTIMFKDAEIEFATIGNTEYFNVQDDSKSDKLIINPLQVNVDTNMIVRTNDGENFIFNLIESEDKYFDIIYAKSNPDINLSEIIDLTNKRRVSIDPALKNIVNFYDINEGIYRMNELTVEMKRVVTISNINKTIKWLRFINDGHSSINIPKHSVKINERELYAVAVESGLETLSPNEFVDYYLILEGDNINKSFTLQANINSEVEEYIIDNIPYDKQKFEIFRRTGDTYENILIENYQR